MRSKSSANLLLSIVALIGTALLGTGIYKLITAPTSHQVDMNITTTTNPNEKSITVDARHVWTDTNIQVRKGQVMSITASGQVSVAPSTDGAHKYIGPDGWGMIPNLYCGSQPCRYQYAVPTSLGALIGKIGNGKAFLVGSNATITAPSNGTLYLGVNDSISDQYGKILSDSEAAAQIFSNNDGSFSAVVQVK